MRNDFFRKVKSCLLLQNIRFLYLLPFFTSRVRKCPVCGGSGVHEFTNRYTPLDRCQSCGHVYSRKVPKRRILNQMYKDFTYWEKDKEHQGIHAVEPGPHWDGYLGARTGIIRKTGLLDGDAPKSFFEIGCSEGMLLRELNTLGHIAEGSEMNIPTAQAGMDALGVTIYTDIFENLTLKPQSQDVVLSFHTIEHITHLDTVFRKIAEILKSDGAVLIEVPCGPEEYNNTDHLHFFYENSLKCLLDSYFKEAEILDNTYTTTNGTQIGSLYGVGRFPK
jgi:SAM-dependent methyltransferase